MDKTLDELPGEGETKTVIQTRCRQECEVCGEPAHYKNTFLLPNYRGNPNSKAYRHDDCSWCEDARQFVCRQHLLNIPRMDGYEHCSTFPAVERFAHMFLYWHSTEAKAAAVAG